MNICVIVTWSSGKPSKAPPQASFLRRAYQCVSLCSPSPFLDPGREGGSEWEGRGGTIPSVLARFLPRDDGKKERERKKKKERKQGDCQS